MLWTASKLRSKQSQFCGVVALFMGAIATPSLAIASDELGQPAQTTTTAVDGGGATLEALLQRIDSLERKNKSLDTQVADLKALEGEKWLSEERAGQIRSVVEDVLADSERRASLRQDT